MPGKRIKGRQKKGGKIILRIGEGWTMLAQLGQLKTELREKRLIKIIFGATRDTQGNGIDQTRLSTVNNGSRVPCLDCIYMSIY